MRGLKRAQIDTRLPTPGCVAAKLSSPQPALKTEVTGEATQPYKDKGEIVRRLHTHRHPAAVNKHTNGHILNVRRRPTVALRCP